MLERVNHFGMGLLPVGWAVLVGGVIVCAYGSGLLDDMFGANPGYENPWKCIRKLGRNPLIKRFIYFS